MSLNPVTLSRVARLAIEVADLSNAVKLERKSAEQADTCYSDPVLTGALRRRSMDLTRALAELRRS